MAQTYGAKFVSALRAAIAYAYLPKCISSHIVEVNERLSGKFCFYKHLKLVVPIIWASSVTKPTEQIATTDCRSLEFRSE